jgi:uracil-DNA glycosylase
VTDQLTVREHKANSHAGHGWEPLTSAIVDIVAAKPGPILFMLWGRPAQAKGALIDRGRHVVIECAHPSPLSAWRGFKGKHPFSRANAELAAKGADPIDWRLARAPGVPDC